MVKRKTNPEGLELKEVKTAGFKQSKRVKGVNRRAGLHDKVNNLEGESRVKRRKPLALKHVRRMRKAALALSAVFVAGIAAVGVGFFTKSPVADLPDTEFSTVCYEAPKDGTLPTEHTLVENVGYLNYVLQNQPFWSSEMHSAVNTVMPQNVHTYKQYYNGVLISADIAQGVSSEATQFCVADGVVMWRPCASKNFDGMNTPWSTKNAQGLTVPQFKKKRGFPPSEFSVYVLNEKTIANAFDYSVSVNADGNFTMSLTLNVNTGVDETSADYYYKQQMLVTGGLDSHPVIEQTTVVYTFDKDWRILAFSISDSYSAKMGISVHCTSNTDVTYFYEEEKAKNSFYDDYFKGEYEKLKDTLGNSDVTDEEPPAPNPLNYLAAAFGDVLTQGATFKVDLSLDKLDLSGAVHVGLDNGSLTDVRVKLGDIGIYIDGNADLYATDGNAKYKLAIGGLLSSSGDASGSVAGLDVNAIIDQLTQGSFTIDGYTAIFDTKLELFGLTINLTFEFNTENGISLGHVEAEIHLGEKLIKAKLCYGTKDDIPSKPNDMWGYTDIMQEGLTLGLGVKFGNISLEGFAKLIMNGGAFGGVYATLGDFTIYFDCPANMLYLSDGNVKYKLALSAFGKSGASAFSEITGLNPVISQIINSFSAADGKVSASATLELFEQTITAALGVKLTGGIAVDANVTAFGQQITANVSLCNKSVELPDFSGYSDVLKDGLTLGVTLKLDGAELCGKVTVDFNGGLNGVRADFGDIKLYYENATQNLYLQVGTVKAFVCLANIKSGSADIASLLGGGVVSGTLADLINNLATGLKDISSSTEINVAGSVIVANLDLNLDGGLSVKANTVLFGINLAAEISLQQESVPALPQEDKEAFINVLENGWQIIDSVIGEKLSVSVEGTLECNEEAYAEYGYKKYGFNAVLEYDKGGAEKDFPFSFDTENGMNFHVDSTLYLHFNLALNAFLPPEDSLYLDLYLLDANPETDANGLTFGQYSADGGLDVYLSVSKYNPATDSRHNPLKIYAPADEIFSLVSMVCAMANIDEIEFKDNAELNAAVAQISNAVNELLINKYIPNTKDQFSSLGESLIPQILGKNLNDFLAELMANLGNVKEEAENKNLSLNSEYIKSITYSDNSLSLVLNSSEIYGTDVEEEENITVELNRTYINNVAYISDIQLKNVYSGDNNVNKLGLSAAFRYDAIEKPQSFTGYVNADGLDTLLKAVVNSATHETPDKDTAYELNSEYVLTGSLNVNLSVLGLAKVDLPLKINSLAVYIDELTNDVAADLHLSYPGKEATIIGFIPMAAVNGTSDVYMSIRNNTVCIKRIQTTDSKNKPITPVTLYREMPLEEFTADIMNQIGFILNLSSTIADNLGKVDTSGSNGNGVSFEGKDFGAALNYVLHSYTVTERDNGADWNININGGLLKDLAAMETDKIPLTFGAYKNSDGTYTVNGLSIAQTSIKIPLIGGSGVTIVLSGDFTYCNPHEKFNKDENGNYYKNTAINLTALSATVNSAFNYDGTFSLAESVYSKTLTDKYGAKLYLPLNVLYTENGQLYTLEGYCLGANSGYYSFAETYTDENGIKYGVVEITDNSLELTADWKKLYSITYKFEDGSEETRNYYENEKLTLANMPAVPEKQGYEGEWLGAEGTSVTQNKTYYLRYGAVKYMVMLSGGQPINETSAEGYYRFENSGNSVSFFAEFGTAVKLPELTSKLYNVYGVYDNPEFNGEPLTEIIIGGAQTYYIKWIGKTFNVAYESDLPFDNSALDTVMRYGDESDYLGEASSEGKAFLGWFIKNGENYKYISDANALKNFLADFEFTENVTAVLSAVWYNVEVTGEITYNSYKYKNLFSKEWVINGYVNSPFSGKSLEIANACSDLSVNVQLQYGISKNGEAMSNNLNNNKWENAYADGSFEKTVSSTHGDDKGSYSGGNVKINISLNGGKNVTLSGSLWKQYVKI
ncbi:MAG: hypothetical protein K2L42_05705 [Clostridia bacterium]|nr:hypothetical protein [Clostridia bacterium]